MKVRSDGLIKVLARKYKGRHTKEQIKEIIERDGANSLDSDITYCGFGVWEINMQKAD